MSKFINDKWAVAVGYNFGFIPSEELRGMILNDYGLIRFEGEDYNLFKANSYEDSRKIDKLLDKYGEYPIKDYRIEPVKEGDNSMGELHNYGLIRFSKKTGEIDTTVTALGKGLIQMWALQNTTKTKACIIVDIDESRPVAEYVGTADGFPKINKNIDEFEFNIPDKLFDYFREENRSKDSNLDSKITDAKSKQGIPLEKNETNKDIDR